MTHIPQITPLIPIAQRSQHATKRPRHPACVDHGGPERGGGEAVFVLEEGEFAEERGDGLAALPEGGCVAVAFFVARHFDKGVVGYGAGEGDAGFDAPVVFVGEEGGVVVEEAVGLLSVLCAECGREAWDERCDVPRLKAAHVVIAL